MTREDWARLWMHFPWGLLAALVFMLVSPTAGLAVLACVFIYEAFNDWRKGDESYKDVLGIVWGFTIPLGMMAIWRLICVIG